MRLLYCLFLSFVLFSVPAFANKQADLKQVESDLKSQQQKQKDLADSQKKIEDRLDDLRGDMIDASREMQDHEKAMLKLQQMQDETKSRIKDVKGQLDTQRESLARIILALQRLNRVPSQALLARPSAPVDMARSFELLQKVIPAVSEQAADIKKSLEELRGLRDTQKQQQEQLAATQGELKAKQDKLQGLVKKRETVLAANKSQQQEVAQKAASLARNARDIRDLLARLDREAKEQAERERRMATRTKGGEAHVANVARKIGDWFGKVTGKAAKLPVAGNVETAYGETLAGGGKSQGLRIKATSGAVVTAPTAGTVRFAGPFRQYRLLVILQHPNGEVSLLGGMQELYTRTGAQVAAGEPLGKLSDGAKLEGDSTHTASLYYERRRNGKPIDPRQARG